MAAIHTIQNRRRQQTVRIPRIDWEPELSDPLPSQAQSRRRRPVVPVTSNAPYVAPAQPHYRRAADTFAVDANGIIHVWNGIDKPQRLNPVFGSYENAGVIAPTTAITLGMRGTGPIVGEFYAYCRFIDRDGNISSLSPISNVLYAESEQGTVTNATQASPIVVTTTMAADISTGQMIKIGGILGNTAANGIFSVEKLTSTTLALYADSSLTTPISANGAYIAGGVIRTGVSVITYGNVPIPTESKVVRRQILRNADGDAETFYVDIDTEDITSSSFESTSDSPSLLGGTAVPLTNDIGRSVVTKTIPPDFKKFVASYAGRLWAAGNEPYSEGAVSVTNGSTVVTGIGTEWGTLTFAGRYIEFEGDSTLYEIAGCSSATAITLSEAYSGTTGAYLTYTIRPADAERRAIYYTEITTANGSEYEAWPRANVMRVAESPSDGEITGLMTMRSWLHVLCENRIYALSTVREPAVDGEIRPRTQRGCVNNRCHVQVEQSAFLMDYLGVHEFVGNDDQDVSTPAVQDLFRTSPNGPYRINWAAKRHFHAVYSPGDDTVRWFVCLGGHYTPYHALCFHVRLRRWWLEEYPWPVASSALGRLGGQPCVFIGTNGKRVMALGQSTLDGPSNTGGTVRGTVTSAGVDWFADSAASFSTSGLVGNPVTIVRGRGKGQRRIVQSVASGRVTVTIPWNVQPDTTSKYQLGGIGWRWRSGTIPWAQSLKNVERAVSAQFKPTTNDSELTLRIYEDNDTDARTWIASDLDAGKGIVCVTSDPAGDLTIDASKANGFVRQRLDGSRDIETDAPRFVTFELAGNQATERQQIRGLIVDGAGGRSR